MTIQESTSTNGEPNRRALPITNTLERVKNYGTLTIFKIAASPFYYARFYEGKKIRKRSTKTANRSEAIKVAKEFFAELKTKKLNSLPLSSKSGFEVCAWGHLKDAEARVIRGELSKGKPQELRARLEKDLIPFFKTYEVAEIDYALITDYINKLGSPPRNLSNGSIKVHLAHLKVILRHAARRKVITAVPEFPTVSTVDKPRPWFDPVEYDMLLKATSMHAGEKFKIRADKKRGGIATRNCELTHELSDLIPFIVNTFIRPTDIKVLQHKHVVLEKGNAAKEYLRLSHPETKSHAKLIATMPGAVQIYERLLARQKEEGYGRPDDYLFQPQHAQNRKYALQQLQRQLDHLLKITNLKLNSRGESRCFYSLRHSAIMFRLLDSENLPTKVLADNARTSPEMIHRFYSSHLSAEMNIEQLHSYKGQKAAQDLLKKNPIYMGQPVNGIIPPL